MEMEDNQEDLADEQSDSEEEQASTAHVRLPLHPRKAQELFFELLQVGTAPTATTEADHHPASPSLQQRITHMQEEYACGLKELKRGHWVKSLSRLATTANGTADEGHQLIQLKLSSDGTLLQISQLIVSPEPAIAHDTATTEDQVDDADDLVALELIEEIPLASITSVLILHGTCFTIQMDHGQAAPFEAESDQVLGQITKTLASTVSAFAGSRAVQCSSKTGQLLWQAIRLRIVELSGVLPLRDAVEMLQSAYDRIEKRETECDLRDRTELFLLQSG